MASECQGVPVSGNMESAHPLVARIERDFKYHAPNQDQIDRMVKLREQAKELALAIVALTPGSREQSLALTNVEQAVMYANAAIARNE